MTYEVCYHVGDGIYSVNMLDGNRSDVFAYAETHSQKFGYDLCSVTPLKLAEVAERKAKGMPIKKVEKKI